MKERERRQKGVPCYLEPSDSNYPDCEALLIK